MPSTTGPLAKLEAIVERATEFRPGKPVVISDPDDRDAVGPLVVAALEDGTTRREVSEAIGVSTSQVGRWVRDEQLRRGEEPPKRRPRNGLKSIRPQDQERAEGLLADLRSDLSAVERAAVNGVTERAGLLLAGRALGIATERLARALQISARSVRQLTRDAQEAGVTVPDHDAPTTAREHLELELRRDEIIQRLSLVHQPYAAAIAQRSRDAFALNALGLTTAKIGEAIGVAQPVVSAWVIGGREGHPGPTELPKRQIEAGPWPVPWGTPPVDDAAEPAAAVAPEDDTSLVPDIDVEARIATLVDELAEAATNLEWAKDRRRSLVAEAGAASIAPRDISAAAGLSLKTVSALLAPSKRSREAVPAAEDLEAAKTEAMAALAEARVAAAAADEAQVDAWLAADASEFSSAELEEHLGIAGDVLRSRIRRARAARDLPGMRLRRPTAPTDLDPDAAAERTARAVEIAKNIRAADAAVDVASERQWTAAGAAYDVGVTSAAIATALGVAPSSTLARIRAVRGAERWNRKQAASGPSKAAADILDELANTAARIDVLTKRRRLLAAEGRDLGMTYAAIAEPLKVSFATVHGWFPVNRRAPEAEPVQDDVLSGDETTHTAALQRAAAGVAEALEHRNHRVLLASEYGMSPESIGRVFGVSAAAVESWARDAGRSSSSSTSR